MLLQRLQKSSIAGHQGIVCWEVRKHADASHASALRARASPAMKPRRHASCRGGSLSRPGMQGNGLLADQTKGPRPADQRSLHKDAIFSPRKRRPSPRRSMAARQDAREDCASVQGLVAVDRWEVQNDQAKPEPMRRTFVTR